MRRATRSLQHRIFGRLERRGTTVNWKSKSKSCVLEITGLDEKVVLTLGDHYLIHYRESLRRCGIACLPSQGSSALRFSRRIVGFIFGHPCLCLQRHLYAPSTTTVKRCTPRCVKACTHILVHHRVT